MKAVRFHEPGGLEKLRYEEVPDPLIGDTEVLVHVRACALNHLDIWSRSGSRGGDDVPLPHISGGDISGEVVKRGKSAKSLTSDTKVIVAPGISCGMCRYCRSGWDSLCPEFRIIGYQTQGGYAEYVAVPSGNLLPIPDKLSFEEAASVPLVFLTAWHMLRTRAVLKPGENVLVWGAGSGVGIAAIQVAKLLGADKVISTVGEEEKKDKAKKLGSDFVLNHHKEDIPAEVKRLTNGEKVNVVFDHVGTATWERSLRSLAPGGRLVNCGVTSGGKAEVDIRYLFVRQFSLLGSYMGGFAELQEVLRFFEDGRLKPVVDSIFPLKDAAKAQERMEKSQQFGKIVLKI
ncbi:MAG TPA: zinc-binding dehydrogenase [Candidatus Binatus sp.]|nr:zinc-binding dehydrogenase [Candidatus Binatus sp.]